VSDPERTELARAPLCGLLVGYLVSGFGTAMSGIAVPWLVLTTTGSATATGVIGFVQMGPYVTAQAVGGPLADRLGLRRTCLLGNAAAAVAMSAIAIMHASGALDLGVLGVLVAVAGVVRGLADASTSPLLPAAAELADVPNERAAGLYSAANRTAMLVGMPLAGVLIAVTSPATVVLLDGMTFVAAFALFTVTLPAAMIAPTTSGRLTVRSYVGDLAEGLRFLRADRLLVGIVLTVAGMNLLDEALTSVLLPVWVRDRLHHVAALGLVGGTLAAGLLTGVLIGAWLGPRVPRRRGYAIGSLVGGAPVFFALAAWASLPPVLTVCIVSGIAGGVVNPIIGATQFERVPAHLQARVLGAIKASAWLGIPFGSLVGGVLAGTIGLRGALLVCGAIMLVITLAPFVFPVWAELDQKRERQDLITTSATVASD
jgi:MFS family permease